MPFAPETRPSLILRLKDTGDADAWEEFVGIYRPVIVRLAGIRGLQAADADDLAQQILISISQRISEWQLDPDRARFRTWLNRVVRNATLNALSRRKPDHAVGGTSTVVLINGRSAAELEDSDILELEWRREALRRAADQIRDEFQEPTWQSFWLTAVEGKSAAEAAAVTGKSLGSVYVARSRVMSRLKEKVRMLSGDLPAEEKR
ncbi:MAG: sigma-70 family RNA polymerase sigma factor [Planctomycetaceae bacterium]|nr:sigma-70 family RNA polymerase sigma factor [Planctomycetaceae bacterium]